MATNESVGILCVPLAGIRRSGKGWIARCPAHADRNPSLWLHEWENGKVFIKCFAGCDYRAVIAAIGGLPWRTSNNSSTTSPPLTRSIDDAKRFESAQRIWRNTRPASGTIVEAYLRSRGITISLPPTIRFHARLKHISGIHLPAMVAAVQAPDGRLVAIHRTFLERDGSAKAKVQQQKMMLGPCARAAVRLAEPEPLIAICEGIETALSVAQACPDLAVWAALSAPGIAALRLPEIVRGIIICADNDMNGTGARAAEAAAERFAREGRRVRIAKPTNANDFNDVLRS